MLLWLLFSKTHDIKYEEWSARMNYLYTRVHVNEMHVADIKRKRVLSTLDALKVIIAYYIEKCIAIRTRAWERI